MGLIAKEQGEYLCRNQSEILHLILERNAIFGLKVAQFMTSPKARQRKSKASMELC